MILPTRYRGPKGTDPEHIATLADVTGATDAVLVSDTEAIGPGRWSVLDATSAACSCTLADGERVGQVVAVSKTGAFTATITGTTIDGATSTDIPNPGVISTLRWVGGGTGWESAV